MNQKIIITGHAGFIGENLTRHILAENYEVIGIDKIKSKNRNIAEYIVDFSEKSIEKYLDTDSIVVHLGAISNDKDAKIDPSSALRVNIIGTQKIIESCQKLGVKKFIFASSEWVYPETTVEEDQTESEIIDLTKLNSYYALTKFMSEQFIRISNLKQYNILRFGIVYGPRKKAGSSPEDILQKVLQGEKIELGSSRTSRRFIYIDDLIEGIIKIIKSDVNKEIFNLSGNQLITLKNISEVSSKITGKKLNFLDLSKPPSIRNPINFKAKKILDWNPSTSLEVGLEKCILKLER